MQFITLEVTEPFSQDLGCFLLLKHIFKKAVGWWDFSRTGWKHALSSCGIIVRMITAFVSVSIVAVDFSVQDVVAHAGPPPAAFSP